MASRLRVASALRLLLVGLAVGGLLLSLLAFTSRWTGLGLAELLWLGLAALMVMVLGLAWIGLRPMPQRRLAAWVDRRGGPSVACSAFLEIQQRGGEPNRVEKALLLDTPLRLAELRPAQLAPLRLPRLALLVALLGVGAAAVALPAVPSSTEAQEVRPETWSLPAPPAAAEEELRRRVERFAHLLYREAELRGDPRLAELAVAAEDLGGRLRGGDLPAADAWADVANLGEAVAQALGLGDDPTFRAGDGAGDAEEGTGARPATNRERATPMPDDGRRPEAVPMTDAPREGERVLDLLLERLEAEAIARAAPAPDADLSDVNLRRGEGTTQEALYFENEQTRAADQAALEAQRISAGAQSDRAGEVVGDADGRGGRAAGDGAQPWELGAVTGRALDEAEVGFETMTIPDRAAAGERNLRIHAPPPLTGASAVKDDGEVAAPPPGWAWRAEAFLGGYRLPAADRAILAALVTPSEEDEDDASR